MIEVGMLDRLQLGDHACLLFDNDRERMAGLTGFIRAGLRSGHRILYFGEGCEQVTAELAGRGIDTAAVLAADQLRLATPYSSYLASGAFDPEATIVGWRDEATAARADGYQGLRAIGDMSWASRPVPGADRVSWYEAHVNRVFADGDAMALCLYDRRLFTDADLQRVCWAHPAAATGQIDPDAAAMLRAVRTTDPPGIRLEGDADLSNRHALRAVMEHLVDDSPATDQPLTVDVSRLRFADATAVRILMHTAVTEAHQLRVVGCSPTLQRLLAFNGAHAVTGLAVEPAT